MVDYINTSGGRAELYRPKDDAMNGRVALNGVTDLRVLLPEVERLAREHTVTSILVDVRSTSLEIASMLELGYTYVCTKPNTKVFAKILK